LPTEDFQLSDCINIKSSIHDYEVFFVEDYRQSLKEQIAEGDFLLIDQNIHALYGQDFSPVLDSLNHIIISPTEEQKSYLNLAPIIDSLIQKNFKKNNRLIAIGGGITQDITAFIACNLYRGVEWFFFPTTLLAQCDSCIGGKSSVNFDKYKNQLGNFYPPNAIVIDVKFLETLKDLDIRSGLGEMIHFYLIAGADDYKTIKTNYDRAIKDFSTLKDLIRRSLQIKKEVIEIDEFDKNQRQVFNYGHSFGHAIESLTNYKIPHGIAVSFGMDIANFLSYKFDYIAEELWLEVRELLKLNWGQTALGEINIQHFASMLQKDKKNIGSKINVILTKGLGHMFKTELHLTDELFNWLEEYFQMHFSN
jgi:3-dehydroquinate synthase